MQSLREVLLILTPLLFPFAVLPAAYGIQLWLMREVRTAGQARWIWLGAGMAVWFMVQLPHFLRIGDGDAPGKIAEREALLDAFSKLPARERDGVLFTDMPGSFLAAGKTRVIGARGECDWRVLTAKYADGSFDAAKLLQVLKDREVTLLHLSRSDDTLVVLLQKQPAAPNFNRIRGFPQPHQVYLVSRP